MVELCVLGILLVVVSALGLTIGLVGAAGFGEKYLPGGSEDEPKS